MNELVVCFVVRCCCLCFVYVHIFVVVVVVGGLLLLRRIMSVALHALSLFSKLFSSIVKECEQLFISMRINGNRMR